MKIDSAWRKKVGQMGFVDDVAQYAVVQAMQRLQDRIPERPSLRGRLRHLLLPAPAPEASRGLYLWGDVGRGKTFLMDLFFDTLTLPLKRRVHFHRLMSEVHSRLNDLGDTRDPLDRIAEDMGAKARVLCFDEFFVSDIGDAMILGRLLDGLFRQGVILVATSNSAPDDLYRDGLQRERFLPAIALLKQHTEVLHMEGDIDYRLEYLHSAGTYLYPATARTQVQLDRYFHEVASGNAEPGTAINIHGRAVRIRKRAQGVVWFEFCELCDGPRSQQDYIEIARRYHTVIVSDVPRLDGNDDNAARRFIALVDEFYDRRVKLILSAHAEIDSLYDGHRLGSEFERTASRLYEMQSTDYLHAAHRA